MIPALLLAAALRHRAVAPPSDQVWFAQHAIALRTVEPVRDETDIGAVLPLVGDARVVALGDATHGTHEFFALKQRLVPYLVKNAGFRTIALEGPYEFEKLDAFVKTGEGDPAAILKIPDYFFWGIEEMLDLVLWIRAWNAAGNPPVTIASIDSVHPLAATGAVVDYLRSVDSAAADRAASRYDCLNDYWVRNSFSQIPPEFRAACRDGVLAVRPEIEARRADYESASSHDAFETALHAARVAEQTEEDFETDRLSRDRHLAENILWHAARAKTLIIGHMAHFGRINYDFNGPVVVPAGTYLTAALGRDYVTFGSALYSGRLSQLLPSGVSVVDIPPPPPADVAQTLARAGMPLMVVPLHQPPSSLAGKQQWRIAATNAVPNKPTYTINGDLAGGWDAVVYVETTSATRVLP